MERRYNLRPRTSGRAQTSSTIQLSSYSHNGPPAETSPSSDIHCLRQALFSAEQHNMELAAENTALKQQLVSHTDRTQQRELQSTKSELKKALEAAKQTQDLLKRKEKLILESHRELSSLRETLKGQTKDLHFSSTQLCLKNKQLNEALTRCSSLEEKLREEIIKREKKEIELSSLGESLITQKEETNLWVNKYEEVKTALEEETKHNADLQYQRELTLKEISSVRSEIQARTEENQVLSSTLDLRENELIQNISRYNALEEKHNIELLLRQSLEGELSSLGESLTAQKEETNLWVNKYEEVKTALEEETKHSADLQYQRELTLKEISSVRSEIQARTEENQVLSSTLDLRENELIQNISRYNALEEKHNIELLLRQSLEGELSSLGESLTAQKEETNLWVNKYEEVKTALEEVTQRSAEWEQRHRELTMELKTRTEEIQVLSSTLTLREEDLKENIKRCHALEGDCKKQLMERQQSWENRQQEEQKLWAGKEEALMKQVSKAEEEVKSLIIQNIGLQELALKKRKKKTRGSWRRRSKKNSSVEEEKKEKNEKKERKRSFWRRRPKRSSEEDEPHAEDGQEEEVKERRGFWRWTSRKRRSNEEMERAAPDKQQ